MYQDEIAQNPEMRAVYLANKKLGPLMQLQVVDRLNDGLWLATGADDEEIIRAFEGTGATLRVLSATSYAVPFRDTIRAAWPRFVRIEGGPADVRNHRS